METLSRDVPVSRGRQYFFPRSRFILRAYANERFATANRVGVFTLHASLERDKTSPSLPCPEGPRRREPRVSINFLRKAKYASSGRTPVALYRKFYRGRDGPCEERIDWRGDKPRQLRLKTHLTNALQRPRRLPPSTAVP